MAFKIRIAAARVNAGMTQQELADAVGVSKTTVINWESNKTDPSVVALREISKISGVPIDFILLPSECVENQLSK
jgi:transcriptional regulator with XRE-family HTH domain